MSRVENGCTRTTAYQYRLQCHRDFLADSWGDVLSPDPKIKQLFFTKARYWRIFDQSVKSMAAKIVALITGTPKTEVHKVNQRKLVSVLEVRYTSYFGSIKTSKYSYCP